MISANPDRSMGVFTTRHIIALAFILLSTCQSPAQSLKGGVLNNGKVTDELRALLSQLQESDSIAVIVTFTDQLSRATFSGRRTSAEPMIRSLQSLSRTSEGVFRSLLEGEIHKPAVRFFWINNSAALKATAGFIGRMAGSPAISTIDYDVPVLMADGNAPTATVLDGDPVWNISKVGADSVWSTYGLDGAGIVVGSMDTGIDTSHPALSGKWRGGSNSWIDVVNGHPAPYDDNGHGTATVGVMVGGDGPGPLSSYGAG
jgi:hypothetical protein